MSQPATSTDPFEVLETCGADLPASAREAILALGEAAVLGPKVLEPALAELEREGARVDALCGVLSDLRVRDERIFQACKALFERDPVFGASASATTATNVRCRCSPAPSSA